VLVGAKSGKIHGFHPDEPGQSAGGIAQVSQKSRQLAGGFGAKSASDYVTAMATLLTGIAVTALLDHACHRRARRLRRGEPYALPDC